MRVSTLSLLAIGLFLSTAQAQPEPSRAYLGKKIADLSFTVLSNRVTTLETIGANVVGPGSATDNALVLFNGTTGKLIKNSSANYGWLVSEASSASNVTTLFGSSENGTSSNQPQLVINYEK